MVELAKSKRQSMVVFQKVKLKIYKNNTTN